MNDLICIMVVSLALSAPCWSLAASQTDDDVAALFYPESLTAFMRARPSLTEVRSWSFKRADLNGTGHADYLVVAYSNGVIGRLRIIQMTPTGPVLVADPDKPELADVNPGVDLLDLDGDGRPEIVARFSTGHSERIVWVFRWQDNALTCLGPPSSYGECDSFGTPSFVDLDGDGTLEIVEPSDDFGTGDDDFPVQSATVFRLKNGTYVEDPATVVYVGAFVRGKGAPATTAASFSAAAGDYVLHVVNGDRRANLVDSATVVVNGKTVLGPEDFKQKRDVFTVPLALREHNSLTVQLRSAPGSMLHLVVTR